MFVRRLRESGELASKARIYESGIKKKKEACFGRRIWQYPFDQGKHITRDIIYSEQIPSTSVYFLPYSKVLSYSAYLKTDIKVPMRINVMVTRNASRMEV